MKVTRSCPTLCNHMDYTRPWNSSGQNTGVGSCSLLQRIFPTQGSNLGLLRWLPVDSLPAEPQGKPKNTGVGGLSLLQQTFPTQESNWGLLHCRQIPYQLSYQGSPQNMECLMNLHVIALIEIIVILYNQLISNALIT